MKTGKILLDVVPMYTSKNAGNRREKFINDILQYNKWTIGAEIGVREGRTSFHLLDNNPQLTMYAIDKDISQFYNTKIEKQYKERLIPLEGISWDMAENIQNNSLDFIFIDAGHGYKSVMKDLESWIPKLKSTGWLMGHDINFPAVYKAVSERCKNFKVGPDNVWFLSPTGEYNMLEKL